MVKSWTELRFCPDVDNLNEYVQKFKELATLLAYPDDHQVQIFKMMMPENIELRIKDMNTLNECIDEAKACIAICQPSSLTSRMSTLTLAQYNNIPSTPPHSRSPSPKRNFRSENSDNRHGRPRQHPPILRKQFQGFWQYPGNFRPCSFLNGRNTFRTNSRFRSFSRSRSFNTSQQIQCYYCHHLGHTVNNCFLRNRQISGSRQSYRGQRPFYNINNRDTRRQGNYRGNFNRNQNQNPQTRQRSIYSDGPKYNQQRVTFADDMYDDRNQLNIPGNH